MSQAPEYTNEQTLAVHTRGVPIALDAGAGCGKTFVLTERLLSHLAPGEGQLQLPELVAITFTDAAAREMRVRVREKCHAKLQSCPAEETKHWLDLLRLLDSARISTIHAFCASLVRAYALELGLDPGAVVLDQPAAELLFSESTDDCLRVLLERRDQDVMQLAAQFGLGGLKKRLLPLREFVGDPQLNDWAARPADEVVRLWKEYFDQVYTPLAYRQLAQLDCIAEIQSLIPECTGAPETRAKLARLSTLLTQLKQGESEAELLAETLSLAYLRGVCGKKDDWPDAEIKNRYGEACKKLRAEIKKVPTWPTDPTDAREAAELGSRLARVATKVVNTYEKAKAENSAIDFGDLLGLARKLLTTPDFSSVQRRVQNSIKLLLVDEFQDTNQQQVEIVKSLVGQKPDRLQLESDQLFFVGDFKQSIYRFRGAEPRVFRDLQDATPAQGRLTLSKNFRSQPSVLNFVNALFGPLFGERYQPLTAHREQLGPDPAVCLLWTQVTDDDKVAATRKAEARQIAAYLKELLSDSVPRIPEKQSDGTTQNRPVVEGDIVLLFRALSDVQHYEEALRDAGVNYRLVGGHAFYSQQEVYDVLNLLRSVASECDEVSLAGALRSPFFSLQDDTLLLLARSGGSLNAALQRSDEIKDLAAEEQAKVQFARETLQQLRRMKGLSGAAAILRTALDLTGYDAALLAEFLGQRKKANLDKVLDQARAAEKTRPGDIDAFVRQLSEFISRQPKEAVAATAAEQSDVVRLMTVHNSKGLEFPVVVVADLNRKLKSDRSSSAFHPQLGPVVNPSRMSRDALTGLRMFQKTQTAEEKEESLRLFYVACTRAADMLVLSAAVSDIENPEGEWLKRLSEEIHPQTGFAHRLPDKPFASVVTSVEQAAAQTASPTGKRPNLPDLIDQAQRNAGAARGLATSVQPIALERAAFQRFSVSRISGKLQHRVATGLPTTEDETEKIDPRKFGTLVHAVMERIEFRPDAEVDAWCQALAPLHLRRHWQAGAEEAAQLVRSFLSSKRCQQLAVAQQVQREIEFAMAWPLGSAGTDAVLQGYIDCLYQDPQGDWRLLDYKTNRATPKTVAKLAEPYRLQMSVYALAVEQALGVRPQSLEVAFLRPGVEVSFAWDDSAKQAAMQEIEQAIQRARDEALAHA